MKEYIKKNLTPLALGVIAGLMFSMTLNVVDGIIIKIALILSE